MKSTQVLSINLRFADSHTSTVIETFAVRPELTFFFLGHGTQWNAGHPSVAVLGHWLWEKDWLLSSVLELTQRAGV